MTTTDNTNTSLTVPTTAEAASRVICQGDGTTGLPVARDHLFGSLGMIGGLWGGVN